MNKKHEDHEDHEAFWAYGGKNLFCGADPTKNNILGGSFWRFSLILPHDPHVLRNCIHIKAKNMRFMRLHEDTVLMENFYALRKMGCLTTEKHEANMREHEDGGMNNRREPSTFELGITL